jgi:dipeptidyl aminopeptidase/acylaminoacyl peptidase
MPDIHFIMDKPGESALECVVAASEAALATASINRERIALMGHSFGGFEACYIASQTGFFRTAIAGSAITDLLSLYLDIDPFNKSNMERFDNGQFRSRIPFTEKEFTSESPLHNAATINIPLLLWAGKEDRLAPTENSIKLHSALWQLGKKSTLLLYPGEGHVIENELHQKDLYYKIMGWLDFYLKDCPVPAWLQ